MPETMDTSNIPRKDMLDTPVGAPQQSQDQEGSTQDATQQVVGDDLDIMEEDDFIKRSPAIHESSSVGDDEMIRRQRTFSLSHSRPSTLHHCLSPARRYK